MKLGDVTMISMEFSIEQNDCNFTILQTACFERTNCTQFTYFDGAKSRCVLFNSCSEPVSSCKVLPCIFVFCIFVSILCCLFIVSVFAFNIPNIELCKHQGSFIFICNWLLLTPFPQMIELCEWSSLAQGRPLYGRAPGLKTALSLLSTIMSMLL